jgi:hypothetical protein
MQNMSKKKMNTLKNNNNIKQKHIFKFVVKS